MAVGIGGGHLWVDQTEADQRRQLLDQARDIATSLDSTQAQRVAGGMGTTAAQEMQYRLASIARDIPDSRVFTLVEQDGGVVFGPGSRTPGQVYSPAPASVFKVFQTGEPQLAAPRTEGATTVITAYAPVVDPRSGKVVLVVGVELPLRVWTERQAQVRIAVILFALLAFAVVVGVLSTLRWLWRRKGETRTAGNLWLTAGVLGIGLVCTALATNEARQVVYEGARRQFGMVCQELQVKIHSRMVAHEQMLRGGAAFVQTSGSVSRRDWRLFTERQNLDEALPGIQGLGFAVAVPRDLLARHLGEVRAEGFPDYGIRPAGDRDLYTSIVYLEPFSGRNLKAFGYDMYSEPVRREAMSRARDQDQPALSGKVTLVQENNQDVQAGTLLYVPVYRRDARPRTVEERRGALVGWVYSPYRMKDLMRGILGFGDWNEHLSIQLEIYDGDGVDPAALLFDSRQESSPVQVASALPALQVSTLVAGRPWTLRFTTETGLSPADTSHILTVLVAGLGLSILLAGLLYSLVGTRTRADRMAGRLTADLREREERIRLLLDSAAEGIYGIDTEGKCTFCNRSALTLLGYDRPEDLLGKKMHWQIHHKRADGTPFPVEDCRIFRAFQTGGNSHADDEVLWRRDGSCFEAEYWSYPARAEGRVVGAVVSFWDITERRRAERKLRELSDRHTLALKASRIGVWDYDPVGGRLVWDDTMFDLFQVPRDPGQASYQTWREAIHPADRAAAEEEWRAALGGDKEFDTEFRILWPDRSVRYLRGLAMVERNAEGQAIRMIGTNWDITARKRTEAQLLEATEKAIDLKAKAEAANAAKGAFLANMSHEIRTPMNGVIGMTVLLQETKLDEEQRRYAQIIRTSGEALLILINDILDFSKIEAGRLELENQDFRLARLVGDVLDLLSTKAQEKGLILGSTLPPQIPENLRGDPGRLRQILINLLGNAVKFTDRGRVDLEISVEARNAPWVTLRFAVRDTGIGVPEDQRHKLFGLFSQVNESVSRRHGGTGLGLAISKQLAELMGGTVGVESEPGRGSVFWFTARFETRAAGPQSAPGQPRGRVLVVDDNAVNQVVAKGLLEKMGCTVSVAADGAAALAQLRQTAYDLVFMDCQMPGMDGFEATQRIRDEGSGVLDRRVPVVAMTANVSRDDEAECVEAGMDDFLTKPIIPEQLAGLLDRWLPGPAGRP